MKNRYPCLWQMVSDFTITCAVISGVVVTVRQQATAVSRYSIDLLAGVGCCRSMFPTFPNPNRLTSE